MIVIYFNNNSFSYQTINLAEVISILFRNFHSTLKIYEDLLGEKERS